MSKRQAEKLLALLQRFIDAYPKVSPETWSAEFVREALTDPDLRHLPADNIMAVWFKELEAKRERKSNG
jgi:hypothetical protein